MGRRPWRAGTGPCHRASGPGAAGARRAVGGCRSRIRPCRARALSDGAWRDRPHLPGGSVDRDGAAGGSSEVRAPRSSSSRCSRRCSSPRPRSSARDSARASACCRASLVAASPIVLYQAIQPMSDVPAAALWMVAVAAVTGTGRRASLVGGLATSAAILVRPNLLPLGLIIGVFLLVRPERTWRERLRMATTYAAVLRAGLRRCRDHAAGLLRIAARVRVRLALGAVRDEPRRRRTSVGTSGWLWSTHTAAVALALLAPWLLPGALTALLLTMCLVNLALYVPYVVFDDWSYLRFLLPTIPLVLILVVAVLDAILRRLRVAAVEMGRLKAAHSAFDWVGTTVVLALAVLFVREAQERPTFVLQQLEARFERAGLFVGDRLPRNAVVITSSESGSVRFYGWTAKRWCGTGSIRRGSIGRSSYPAREGLRAVSALRASRRARLPAAVRRQSSRSPRLAADGRGRIAGPDLSTGRQGPVSARNSSTDGVRAVRILIHGAGARHATPLRMEPHPYLLKRMI